MYVASTIWEAEPFDLGSEEGLGNMEYIMRSWSTVPRGWFVVVCWWLLLPSCGTPARLKNDPSGELGRSA